MLRPTIIGLLLALALPRPASALTEAQGRQIVYCHDAGRALVQTVRLRHCAGRVVSQTEAIALNAAITREREARKARLLTEAASRSMLGLQFKSAGAAFAVNTSGALLTSAHVIRGCDALEARRDDDPTPLPLRVAAVSEANDLAIVEVGQSTPEILRFSPSPPTDGAPLALIGYPSEGMIRRIPRMTPVLVSHAISDPLHHGLIGIAGDVRRGNSGGPALDSRGLVVGVLKAKINTVAARRVTGRVLTNLGVIVDHARVLAFLRASRTPFTVDTLAPSEKTGRALFATGRRAVYRIDCLVRSSRQ